VRTRGSGPRLVAWPSTPAPATWTPRPPAVAAVEAGGVGAVVCGNVSALRPLLAISLAAAALLVAGHTRAEGAAAGSSAPEAATPAAHTADTAAGSTVVFPYLQRRLLYSRNGDGGLAYVSSGATAGAALPVVVLLHGMNADELMHPWFGPPYGDLRPVLESLVTAGKVAPLVIAAPTHTRYATGASVMWPRFDLDGFLDATQAALGDTATLDRARVVVVGHSGAGCNRSGGILAPSIVRAKPLALVDVDGCLDTAIGSALARASEAMPVYFYWQHTWPRPIASLESACPACKIEEISDLPSRPSPHDAILPEALRRVLPALLPREPR
jgi:hypothetical protein